MAKLDLGKIIEQQRDYSPHTPAGVLKEFMSGSIHEDFLQELAVRIESFRDLNEVCDSKQYLETRGGIKALRLVSGIFNDLYENAISDNRGRNAHEQENANV